MGKKTQKRKHKQSLRKQRLKKKKSTFKKVNRFSSKHPVWTGIILIVISVVLMRLSFTNAFLRISEVSSWSRVISIGLFIASIFVLNKYWRNHVVTMNTKHNVTWRNR